MAYLTSDDPEARALVEDLGRALLVLQEAGWHGTKRFLEYLKDIRYTWDTHLAFEIERDGLMEPSTIRFNQHYKTGSTIERLELLLSAIYLCEDTYFIAKLCLGGAQTTVSFAERWRLLGAREPLQNMRIARFEDRKPCVICHIPMASDTPIARTPHGQLVHSQCNDYLHKVMIPALKAQRAAQAASAASDV